MSRIERNNTKTSNSGKKIKSFWQNGKKEPFFWLTLYHFLVGLIPPGLMQSFLTWFCANFRPLNLTRRICCPLCYLLISQFKSQYIRTSLGRAGLSFDYL